MYILEKTKIANEKWAEQIKMKHIKERAHNFVLLKQILNAHTLSKCKREISEFMKLKVEGMKQRIL